MTIDLSGYHTQKSYHRQLSQTLPEFESSPLGLPSGAESNLTRGPEKGYRVRRAHYDDLDEIYDLLVPFFEAKKLLDRSRSEILLLMATGFVAELTGPQHDSGVLPDPKDTPIVGFASVEIYSKKLGEIQCLAVTPDFAGQKMESELVKECVELARNKGVMEVMAISSSDEFLREIGFDYSLPEQKKALFYEVEDLGDPESVISSPEAEKAGVAIKPLNGYKIRRARFDEQDTIAEFLTPFFAQKKLLKRTRSEILLLMATGFVAEASVEPASEGQLDPRSAIIGFASVEIYSEKMSEIQCLAVSEQHQGKGIGSALVQACLELAKQKGIVEVMAISSSDAFLQKLGFEYSLPEQKRALFYQLRSRADVFNRDE